MKAREKLCRVLPWLVLAAAYLFTVGMYAMYGSHNLNSDISSEIVLADLLNEEGKLVTENWYYSTELRVVSHIPLYQIGLLLFPGCWHMAHTFAIAVLLAGVAACVIYMLRGAGIRDAGVYAAAALLLPVSEVHRFLFSMGGSYMPFVILASVLVGLTLRMPVKKGRALRVVLLAALSFWGGLSGVRMPMFSGAPLMIACAIEMYSALRRARTVREAVSTGQMGMTVGAGVSAAFMLAGYAVNAKVLTQTYHFSSYGSTQLFDLNLEWLLEQVRLLAEFYGYQKDVPLMSLSGISNVLAIGLVLLMALGIIAWLRHREERSMQERVILYFTVFSVAIGMVLNILTGREDGQYVVGYFMMGALMLAVMAFLYVGSLPCSMRGVRTAALCMLALVFFAQAKEFTAADLRASDSEYEKAADWLVENGYESGYATFWNGNVLTDVSDGKLEMYVYGSWTQDTLSPWLQKTSHFDQLPEGKVFVIVDETEFPEGPIPLAQEEKLIYVSDSGYHRIYGYDSAQEVEAIQREFHEAWESQQAASAGR